MFGASGSREQVDLPAELVQARVVREFSLLLAAVLNRRVVTGELEGKECADGSAEASAGGGYAGGVSLGLCLAAPRSARRRDIRPGVLGDR